MDCQDYNVLEDLLSRLHSVRNACERVIFSLKQNPDLVSGEHTVARVKRMSETTQGVIDCIEKKMYDLDATSFVSSWLPEALVHHCGLVGRPRLSINPVQIEFLRAWHFSWTRIAFTLCISRSTL